MASVLKTLIEASERAARVARSCATFNAESLVVTEKCEGEANTRFEKDFKTIADVLAQESAKTVIICHFPQLCGNIRGEECSEIGGVKIVLQENIEETTELLSALLPSIFAKKMAEAAYSDTSEYCPILPIDLPEINSNDIGVWIDPIDGTAEFISGIKDEAKPGQGLPCVTVLVGAYLKLTGEPVIGVINQPFYKNYKGRIIWGMHFDNFHISSEDNQHSKDKFVLMSRAEKPEVIQKFKTAGWVVNFDPGAGNKLMKVALGEASAYIVSQGTIFRWDTCAPHAIILAKGGNVLSYKNYEPITYNVEQDLDTKEYCNKNGIIAYISQSILDEIKSIIM